VIVEIHLRSTIHMSKIVADVSAVATASVDLAKHVFQIHAVDASGKVVVARVP
jgi:transposase